nr:hypothetical protein CFP56_00503 [Quercus suber]
MRRVRNHDSWSWEIVHALSGLQLLLWKLVLGHHAGCSKTSVPKLHNGNDSQHPDPVGEMQAHSSDDTPFAMIRVTDPSTCLHAGGCWLETAPDQLMVRSPPAVSVAEVAPCEIQANVAGEMQYGADGTLPKSTTQATERCGITWAASGPSAE